MKLNFGKNPEYTVSVGFNTCSKYGRFALPIGLFWGYDNAKHFKALNLTLSFLCFTFSIGYWYWRNKE